MNEGHLRTFGPGRTSRRRPAGSQRRLVRPAEPSRDGVRMQPALGPRASGLGPRADRCCHRALFPQLPSLAVLVCFEGGGLTTLHPNISLDTRQQECKETGCRRHRLARAREPLPPQPRPSSSLARPSREGSLMSHATRRTPHPAISTILFVLLPDVLEGRRP